MKFLLDSNVWLDLILERAGAAAVYSLLEAVPGRLIALTDLSLHSIAIFVTRTDPEKFATFLEDLIESQVGILHLPPTKLRNVLSTMMQTRLDFDDAVQLEAAAFYDLQIISFDSDFDRTPPRAPYTRASLGIFPQIVMTAALIRPAHAADLVAINDIYNHYVQTSTCTYQEEPESYENRVAWFARHGPGHPVIVAVERAGPVVGWASLSPFHARSAYRFTVEDSVYVRHDCHGHGIGSQLLSRLIELAGDHRYKTIIAGIDAEQPPSIALHRKFGFEVCGGLKQVGFKFNRWLDVVYMQKAL